MGIFLKNRIRQIVITSLVIIGIMVFTSSLSFADSGPGAGNPGVISNNENGNIESLPDEIENKAPVPETEASKKTDNDKESKSKTEPLIKPGSSNADENIQPPPSLPAVTIEKKESLLKDFAIKYQDKLYPFQSNPIAYLEGKVYVCASDPDFGALLGDMGLTYSWFSFSGKLFIYLRHGSITWQVQENYAMVGNQRVEVPLKARNNFGIDYIPLDTLAKLMNLQVKEIDKTFEIRPAVQVIAEKSRDEDTLDLFVCSASSISYEIKYQARPPSIRFTIPKAGYNNSIKKLLVEGVQVRINDTLDPDKIYITMEFPPHWKGKIIPTSYKNEILVRMKPNMIYAWDAKDELLKSIDLIHTGSQTYMTFNTSDAVQYYWAFDPDESILYIDVPFATPSPQIRLQDFSSELVKNCQIASLKPDGVNITRLKIELEPETAFMIGPPEKQGSCSFALLVGKKETIQSPSPFTGSAEIMIAGQAGRSLIVIDPGHGGSDPGACNHSLGLMEKDINLDISKRMAALLTRRKWRVILTRYHDTDLTYPGSPDVDELQARVDVANNKNAAVFISIHCNASTSKNLRGSSYHWFKFIDKPVASALAGSLGYNIGTIEKGPRRDQFYVLSHTKVPAALVEIAFLSNPADAAILASSKRRQEIADKLARAIELFLYNTNLAGRPVPAGNSGEE